MVSLNNDQFLLHSGMTNSNWTKWLRGPDLRNINIFKNCSIWHGFSRLMGTWPLLEKHILLLLFFLCRLLTNSCRHQSGGPGNQRPGGGGRTPFEWENKWRKLNSSLSHIDPPRPPPKSLIDSYKHRHKLWVSQVEALSSMSGPTERHPWRESSNQPSSYKNTQKIISATELSWNPNIQMKKLTAGHWIWWNETTF